jgi:hypothetical protein
MKIPEPFIEPATSMVESRSPRPWTNPDLGARAVAIVAVRGIMGGE